MSHSIDLDGTWKLTWKAIEGTEGVPECKTPIDGVVPGDVHVDLIRAGLLPEPLIGANAPKHEWVERAVFSYERDFTVDYTFDRAELVFDGLDCLAQVFIDGNRVGSSANAFVPHTLNVSSLVTPGTTHKLRVEVDTGVQWGRKQDHEGYQNQTDPERMFLRKSQFSFKWDWAPRLVTCGIWRHARLNLHRNAVLRDVMLTSQIDGSTAHMDARIKTQAFVPGDYLLKLRVVRGPAVWQQVRKVQFEAGHNEADVSVEVDPVELWWPAGHGDQPLYVATVEVEKAGEMVDEYSTTYGFRTIRLRQDPIGEGETTFIVNVNGVDIFCKGANWVPADSITARVTDAKYEALITEAVAANFNMFRIWGGGIYESDTFYDLCDRHGVMIWQDFMFACAEYPDGLPWFVENVRDEFSKIIPRLRNHPCIALWCGNNECDWGCSYSYGSAAPDGGPVKFKGWSIYHEILPVVCAELDPHRPYWPSSPFGGPDPNHECCGDRHVWSVSIQAQDLTERADVRNYRKDRGKFSSEYGVLSHALPRTILDYTGEDQLSLTSEAAKSHDNHFNNTSTQGEPLTDWYLKVGFGEVPSDELTYLRQSLAYQAMGYREAISSFRIRKFGCAGSLFWMYSDCWGTLGWTIIDYYLRRKPSFYWVRKAYAPVAVFARAEGDVVKTYVVNDLSSEVRGQMTLEVGDLSGEGKSTGSEIVIPANGVAEGPSMDFGAGYAFARLQSGGATISEDLILTRFPSEIEIPPANLNTAIQQVGDDVQITIRPDGFAHFVWIDHPDDAVPTDNAFNILPNRPKIVLVRGCGADQISVTALNSL